MSETKLVSRQISDLADELSAKQDTLVSGTNIKTINSQSLLGSGNITIAGGEGSGEANTTSNVGTGTGLALPKQGVDLPFRALRPGTGIALDIAVPGGDVLISNTSMGEANTAANKGAGQGVYSDKAGTVLRFKSLVAGSNISLSSNADTITITSSAEGGASNVITEYTATASQTVFSVPGGYTPGSILVYRNGSLLQSNNYTATNGTSVTLAVGATAGDDIKIVSSLAGLGGGSGTLPNEIIYPYTAFWRNEGAKIHELNDRVMVGGATVNDGLAVPVVKDWLETERESTTKNSQLAVLATIGQTAILGGSRTSDFPIAASMGCIGINGWAINDNTAQVQTAYASYFEARRKANTGDTHGMEVNIANEGDVQDQNPQSFFPTGLTSALWIASGGELAASPATAAISILDNGAKFRKGLVFKQESLDVATNIAIEMGQDHIVRWRANNGNTAELVFDGTNIILRKNGVTVGTW